MGKPLINLVDNMVKLGSLYRGGDNRVPAQQDPNRSRPYYPVGQMTFEIRNHVPWVKHSV